MAGEEILDYTGMASIAYKDALDAAKNAQNMLLRQFGFTMPSASGEYNVESAQAAFDPNALFSEATGAIDTNKIKELAGRLTVGGTGVLSDIMRSGATAEADIAAESRMRGFGGEITGGIIGQRRALAERQTGKQLGTAKEQFLSGLGEALSPIGGAYQNLQTAMLQDEVRKQEAAALEATINRPESQGESESVSTNPPSNPRTYQRWVNPATKQRMVYINGKWKKANK